MLFETIENTLQISCNMIMTTALAAVLLLVGFWIKGLSENKMKICSH